MTTSNTCIIDGCDTPVGSTGKRGRPKLRCEEHSQTCSIPGCIRQSESTVCGYHRVAASVANQTLENRIARYRAFLEENGYTVTDAIGIPNTQADTYKWGDVDKPQREESPTTSVRPAWEPELFKGTSATPDNPYAIDGVSPE